MGGQNFCLPLPAQTGRGLGRGVLDLRNFGLLTPPLSSGGGEGGKCSCCLNCSADHRTADEITLLPVPDHLRAADAAKRAQRGHEINRFEDVRLALRVIAKQQVEARRKIRVQPRVIAEVPESQMGQMHVEKIGARTARPRVFSAGEIVADNFLKLCRFAPPNIPTHNTATLIEPAAVA